MLKLLCYFLAAHGLAKSFGDALKDPKFWESRILSQSWNFGPKSGHYPATSSKNHLFLVDFPCEKPWLFHSGLGAAPKFILKMRAHHAGRGIVAIVAEPEERGAKPQLFFMAPMVKTIGKWWFNGGFPWGEKPTKW